jgi:hypothetical protein
VEDRTLVIRRDPSAGGFAGDQVGPARITVSTHELSSALLRGSGAIAIDHMRGLGVTLTVIGAGQIALADAQADRLGIEVDGAGRISVAGKARELKAGVRGTGVIDGAKLSAAGAELLSSGAGDMRFAVTREAKVANSGSGNVTITGDPACTVQSVGSGSVVCGNPVRR